MSRRASGMTLLETLLALAILSLILGLALGGFGKGSRAVSLSGAAATVRGALEDARWRTLAARNDVSYGVHLAQDAVTLFPGSAYDPASPENERIALSPSVALTHNLSSGASDVLFARLSGAASATGTVTLSLKENPTRAKTIVIESTGLVTE